MLIQTQQDAQIALQALANDITNTETTQVPQIGVADGGLFGWLGINSPGSAGVRQASLDLLNQLAGYVLDIYSGLDLEDPTAKLDAKQIAKMKLVRSQVVEARATVQSLISELNWSFGDFVADSLTAARELADKAVEGGVNLLGLKWWQVEVIGGLVAGAVVYGVYRRVRG